MSLFGWPLRQTTLTRSGVRQLRLSNTALLVSDRASDLEMVAAVVACCLRALFETRMKDTNRNRGLEISCQRCGASISQAPTAASPRVGKERAI